MPISSGAVAHTPPHTRLREEWNGMHTGSRPKEWNATGDLGTNHSVPAHTKRGGQDLGGPGIGSSEHIGEDAATHHREDDACADHAMHAQSGGGVIGDAPRHRG